MADGGVIGNGVKVGYRIEGSPLAPYTEIGQIINVSGLELMRDKIDSTVSSTNIYKRSFPGMAEVSDFVLELLANRDELNGEGVVQEALFDLFEAGTTMNWRVEIPVNRNQSSFKGYNFDGYLLGVTPMETPVTDRQVFRVTIAFDDTTFSVDPAGASDF